jgi:hypothetical protein
MEYGVDCYRRGRQGRFSKAILLQDMEKTDRNVRFLLPKILTLAAHLEQTDPPVLIRNFSEKVRAEIS